MKDLEKQIEKAAKDSYKKQCDPEESSYECFFHYTDELLYSAGFYEGFKSSETKQYWQQGMYSINDISKIFVGEDKNGGLFDDYLDYCIDNGKITFKDWFNQNKKK